MGGILANERCQTVLSVGTHGSTFGANPVSAAAALAVLDSVDDTLLAEVKEKGDYLRTEIEKLGSPYLGEVNGMGLMLGIAVKGERQNGVWARLLAEHGLLCLTAGQKLRLLPPLTITKDEIDKGLAMMKAVLVP